MRGGWLSLVLAAMPSLLSAQSVVLSGEHPGFTRLVAPIAPGADWQVEQSGRTVTFTVDSPEATYDLRDVFDLIPRSRVNTVQAIERGFSIELACDCVVTSEVFAERFIVMDVALAEADSALGLPEEKPEPASVVSPAQPPVLPLIPERRPVTSLQPVALPELARRPLTDAEEASLDAVQRELAAGIGVAATRGLIRALPGRDFDPAGMAKDAEQQPVSPAPAATSRADAAAPPPSGSNIRITSSMDVQGPSQQGQKPVSLSGHDCPADDSVDLSSWSEGPDFYQQLGSLRRQLFGEFDRLDEAVALQLAKLYLHFGFGAEAAQILGMRSGQNADASMLRDIAAIMQGGAASPDSHLPKLLDCDADVALWAILAQETLDSTRHIDPGPALKALNKLPDHLRTFLAPELSRRLLRYGDEAGAAAAMRTIERLPTELPAAAKLAQAEIAIKKEETEAAKEVLKDVISQNAEPSPEALIALFKKNLETGTPIDPQMADLVAAYAKELHGSALGPQLRRVHVLALANSGQFDAAFTALAELGGNEESEEASDTRLELIRVLTEAASDVVFLEHAFLLSEGEIGQLPVSPRLALASRLLALGFAPQAEAVIAGMVTRPVNPTRQLLAARIALARSQPRRAIAELGELSGEEATLIRAEAYRMAGAYAEARSFFALAGAEDDAAAAAWLAGDTDAPELADDSLLGPVTLLSQVEMAPPTEIDGMIATGTAALEESAEARRILSDLLNTSGTGSVAPESEP